MVTRVARMVPAARSKQNTVGIEDLPLYVKLHNWVIAFSVLLLFYNLFFKRHSTVQQNLLVLVFLVAILINAFLAAAFANVIDRLGSKMIFFVPLALVYLGQRKSIKKGHTS